MSNGSKEIILGKIRRALASPVPKPFESTHADTPVLKPTASDLAVVFAENFVNLQGQFSYCLNISELRSQMHELAARKDWHRIYCADPDLRKLLDLDWYEDLASCNAAITGCEALVARTGSIVLSASHAKGRTASVYAPVHICIAFGSQLVEDIADALAGLQSKYGNQLPSMVSFASGPSRTADIEKTLVTGVHGPKEVFCYLVEA